MANETTQTDVQKPHKPWKQVTLGNMLSIISMAFTVIGAAWYVGSGVFEYTSNTDRRLSHAEWQMEMVQNTLNDINRKLGHLMGDTREGRLQQPNHDMDEGDVQ